MAEPGVTVRNPWAFIPSLYFCEGLPYVLVNTVSVILYKKMGIDNAHIAFWTSWLYLPWVIKMFWGPLVDVYTTKRKWILSTQFAMAVCLVLLAYVLTTEGFFYLSLLVFIAGAFISATHDIAADGFYIVALTGKQQAAFVGFRAAFYRLAMIFGTGGLVYMAGHIESATENIPDSWIIALSVAAALFVVTFIYHHTVLPFPASDGRPRVKETVGKASFWTVIKSYCRQERIGVVIAFILFYRLGEAMLMKLVSPFLLDKRVVGGLGLSTQDVGVVYGTVGILCLVFGGILGGWLIAKFGFRRCIWPMVPAMHLPDLFFVYMAYAQPSLELVYPLVALEQLGYGVGFTAFTVYLMYSVDERYKTAHYAISTGIMAFGMMVPGFASGWLQQRVGYETFFIIVCFMTIPGMLTIPFLPNKEKKP